MNILPLLNRFALEMVEDQHILPVFSTEEFDIDVELAAIKNGRYETYKTVSVGKGDNVFGPIRDYIEEKRKEYTNLGGIVVKAKAHTDDKITLWVRVGKVECSLAEFQRAEHRYYKAMIFDVVTGRDGKPVHSGKRVVEEGRVPSEMTEAVDVFQLCKNILDKHEVKHHWDPSIDITRDGDKVYFELAYHNDLTG